ncbi:FMN-dependent NADH-azoreductase [Paenibacillus eucommiae]|uniref:FMN dependent NADH:quinone oxidoreductase n=1 Tax=Paenibacillus eucommiae TaxID=1355755 RepID=A0ABS4IQB1_9BACL|nr:FMN-dependent NADH-azoreductase [Paenibacillus eucommiae]MBP1989754.1 FMN-dependent NADH-azoreductase [Paenibacillus eucommiae]
MANVLFIKANDRPAEQAISLQMYETFLNTFKETHASDVITELDLYKEELPYYGNDAITGMYKLSQGYELTPQEQEATNIVSRYLDQFLKADKVVIAFPLWNYVAPAPLISYISYLTQVGKTFRYTAEGPVGLVGDKKVVLLNARGGIYSTGPMSAIESAIKPLKATLGLFGIEAEVVIIEGHNQFKDRSAQIISEGLEETAKIAANF